MLKPAIILVILHSFSIRTLAREETYFWSDEQTLKHLTQICEAPFLTSECFAGEDEIIVLNHGPRKFNEISNIITVSINY
uniref:Uncharacterized protein n=1 Tax=Romanomermis culicivorax TaxID=13658 RepID=A0A915K014_ROMCU